MEKKMHLIVPMGLLVVLSGCSWRSKKSTPSRDTDRVCQEPREESRLSKFDEHEREFVLEDTENPFAPEGGTPLADAAPLWVADQKVEFETVYFGFDQYRIAPEQQEVVNRVADAIRAVVRDGSVVVIEGHACNSAGSPRYNTMLSERRAQEVRTFLVKAGIPAEQLRVVGRGSEMRKVLTGNREQQAPNRRVEFYVVQEAEQAE